MISETWIVISADAKTRWDVGQNQTVSNPTLTVCRTMQAGNNLIPGLQFDFQTTIEELANYTPGQHVTVQITPVQP